MKRLVLGTLVGLMASGLLLTACGSVPGPGPAPATSTSILQATETTAAPTPTTGVIGPAPTISTGSATSEPSPTSAPSPSSAPGPTSVPSPAAAPSATRTPIAACTERATFVADVTIPDNTVVAPAQTFVKTWRVRNTGTCTWGTGYELVFVRGTAMTTTRTLAVPTTAPGATVDLAVPMTAPTAGGRYSGFWRLRAPNGVLYGDTVWVIVQVSTATPTP